MKRFAFVLSLLPALGLADDPFLCVDPDIREAFIPSFPSQTQYSTNLPDGFIEHSAPESAELVGSQVNKSLASVVYKTKSENIDYVVDEIVTSLEKRKWQDVGKIDAFTRRGFQDPAIPKIRRLCHDKAPGLLAVSSREAADSGWVTLSAASTGTVPRRGSCRALKDGIPGTHQIIALAEEVPNLKLPAGVRSQGAGSGGGGDDYQTNTVVVTAMPRERLVELLNTQIRDQGWEPDGDWSGTRSTGSAWFKESKNGNLIVGTLHAFGESGSPFILRFSINLADDSRQTGQGVLGFGSQ